MDHKDNDINRLNFSQSQSSEAERLERELQLLDMLKREERQNYAPIIGKIRSNRRRRTFMALAPLAAASLIAVIYILNTVSFLEPASLYDAEVPMLITDSGNAISLDKEEEQIASGKTLSIKNQSNRLTYKTQPASEAGNYAGKESEVKKQKGTDTETSNDGTIHRVKKNTVVIPSGYTYSVELSDGSEVFINSRSNIKYPVTFDNDDARIVEMRGEAYFKVAKSDKPFIVKAGDIEVKVYGTEFNVNTNKQGTVETILVEGSVGITDINGKETLLAPGQLYKYNLKESTSSVMNINPEDYLAWMKGDFTYDNQPLSVILDEISAHYGIKISYNDDALQWYATISLSRRLGYRQIMQILESALGEKPWPFHKYQ